MVAWTRLTDTSLWDKAKEVYNEPHRTYHNMIHITRMYEAAERLKVPYSAELDFAILFHDWVYDGGEHVEYRSAAKMVDILAEEAFGGNKLKAQTGQRLFVYGMVVDVLEASSLIMRTHDHHITGDSGDIIVILDLFDFGFESRRKANFNSLSKELHTIYPEVSSEELYSNMHVFLKALLERMVESAMISEPHPMSDTIISICNGMANSIAEISEMLQKYTKM